VKSGDVVTAEPPTSIISGVDYEVAQVNEQPPRADEDFEGELTLSLVYDPAGAGVRDEQVVRGLGMAAGSGIYVNEKDAAGKDVRRWLVVRQEGTGTYVARQGLY
jgi:hypothetical protein